MRRVPGSLKHERRCAPSRVPCSWRVQWQSAARLKHAGAAPRHTQQGDAPGCPSRPAHPRCCAGTVLCAWPAQRQPCRASPAVAAADHARRPANARWLGARLPTDATDPQPELPQARPPWCRWHTPSSGRVRPPRSPAAVAANRPMSPQCDQATSRPRGAAPSRRRSCRSCVRGTWPVIDPANARFGLVRQRQSAEQAQNGIGAGRQRA